MADTVKNEYNLKIECLFTDGDTRTITLKNPKSEITQEEIEELNALILNETGGVNNSILIGDKTSADFRRINKVIKVTTITNTLDLG